MKGDGDDGEDYDKQICKIVPPTHLSRGVDKNQGVLISKCVKCKAMNRKSFTQAVTLAYSFGSIEASHNENIRACINGHLLLTSPGFISSRAFC
ncbi:hypothetical protein CEXT_218191 [Caerostris extrusa]|uniref:Uncharacterized protein n=1 Tax=Caerostris extrusa TaxID=172846 RepID=A0AAV4Y410_CAEEX|nr:hypothetical protein CEXT_218191 [Caerostris extrusa]